MTEIIDQIHSNPYVCRKRSNTLFRLVRYETKDMIQKIQITE